MELKYKHIFVLIALSLGGMSTWGQPKVCLLYTSDAADE